MVWMGRVRSGTADDTSGNKSDFASATKPYIHAATSHKNGREKPTYFGGTPDHSSTTLFIRFIWGGHITIQGEWNPQIDKIIS